MAEHQRKRCLYEILGVGRDSSQEEIRTAYRRLALQLHPDKVAASGAATSPSAATSAFQELLHAYEVLSDPKERSYYDSHRSQILFADSSSSKSHKSSSSPFFNVDLYSFFSTSAFSGFSNTGRGFYKVYGDLFAKLYAQELWFAKELGLGDEAVAPAPLIGNIGSDYTQVVAFYNYWLQFLTVMDFGWVDAYDTTMGPNRRSRRAMEEENKKVRKKARREYNDSVRGLAAFVKKRDKRVVDMQIKKNLEEEKRRAEEKAKKKEEERKKLERAMMYEEPEWARVDDNGEELVDDSEDDKKTKKGKGADELYCVVCNKKFKSDKQWKNHEQSKKHKEKVAELRIAFKEEKKILGDDDEEKVHDEVHVGFDYEAPEAEDSNVADELCAKMKDDLGLQEVEVEDESIDGDDRKVASDDEASVLEAMISGKKNKKSSHLGPHDSSPGRDSLPDNDDQSSTGYDSRRRARSNRAPRRGTDREADDEDVSDIHLDESEVQNQESNAGDIEESSSCSVEEVENVGKNKGDRVNGKKLKHHQVDVKSDGKKGTVVDSKKSSKGKKEKGPSKATRNSCGTCGEDFGTRNKLFAHLGDTGHAVLKSR